MVVTRRSSSRDDLDCDATEGEEDTYGLVVLEEQGTEMDDEEDAGEMIPLVLSGDEDDHSYYSERAGGFKDRFQCRRSRRRLTQGTFQFLHLGKGSACFRWTTLLVLIVCLLPLAFVSWNQRTDDILDRDSITRRKHSAFVLDSQLHQHEQKRAGNIHQVQVKNFSGERKDPTDSLMLSLHLGVHGGGSELFCSVLGEAINGPYNPSCNRNIHSVENVGMAAAKEVSLLSEESDVDEYYMNRIINHAHHRKPPPPPPRPVHNEQHQDEQHEANASSHAPHKEEEGDTGDTINKHSSMLDEKDSKLPRPWSFGQTSHMIATETQHNHLHFMSWTFRYPPTHIGTSLLPQTNWEDAHLVSVLVLQHPMRRILMDATHGSREHHHLLRKGDWDAWWKYATQSPITDNFGLRILAGDGYDSEQDEAMMEQEVAVVSNSRNEHVPDVGDGGRHGRARQHLEAAKALMERFTFVIDEACLEESIHVLGNMVGVRLPNNRRRELTKTRKTMPGQSSARPDNEIPSSRALPFLQERQRPDASKSFRDVVGHDDVYKYLLEKNQLDIELYEYAKGLRLVQCMEET